MSAAGKWNISMDTPIGKQQFTWDVREGQNGWEGALQGPTGGAELKNVRVDGEQVQCESRVSGPMGPINLAFTGNITGDEISGTCKTAFGNAPFSGRRA